MVMASTYLPCATRRDVDHSVTRSRALAGICDWRPFEAGEAEDVTLLIQLRTVVSSSGVNGR